MKTQFTVEAVPKGPIPTLKKQWERSCCTNPLPIDTILLGGLEDIKEAVEMYDEPVDNNAMAEEGYG